jgi:prepilin-type N-terminal cleavage/methylation domain-containing protein
MLAYKASTRGFSLIEILIVITLIGLLAAIVVVNMNESSAESRDVERQADLRNLQSAIEAYKSQYGRYPYQATSTSGGGWSGQLGTIYAPDNGSSQYIVGLAPEFIPVLPADAKLNGTNSGYVYRTNANGTIYKVMAMRTVESELVNYNHPLKSCDIRPDNIGRLQNLGPAGVDTSGWCTTATLAANEPPGSATSYGPIPNCRMSTGVNVSDGGNGRFERSYGLWGGFEPLAGGANRAAQVRNTAVVICK